MIVEDLKAVLQDVSYHSIRVSWWREDPCKHLSVDFRDLDEFMYNDSFDECVIASIKIFAGIIDIEVEVE